MVEPDGNKIVAIGLLTSADLARLGSSLRQIFPLDAGQDFADILRAIDEAQNRISG